MNKTPEISAIIPVESRLDESGSLAATYLEVLDSLGKAFEMIFVLDGQHPALSEKLMALSAEDKRVRVVQLAKNFGEAAALNVGFSFATAPTILTLPAYYQIEAGEIPRLLEEAAEYDVAVG